MKIIRFLHKLYAWTFGYFWLPCPLCGEMFGGHEWEVPEAVLWRGENAGAGVCKNCIERASIENKKAYPNIMRIK